MEFPKSIIDGDIELVKLEPTFENTKLVFDLIDRNREYLGKWLNWVKWVEKPEDYFNTIQEMARSEKPEYFIMFQGNIVGAISVHNINRQDMRAEHGGWVIQEFSGRGIYPKAARIMEKLAFVDMGLNRIELLCDKDNERSVALVRGLNYFFEGELRNYFYYNGKHSNMLMFSKLKSEWEVEQKNA